MNDLATLALSVLAALGAVGRAIRGDDQRFTRWLARATEPELVARLFELVPRAFTDPAIRRSCLDLLDAGRLKEFDRFITDSIARDDVRHPPIGHFDGRDDPRKQVYLIAGKIMSGEPSDDPPAPVRPPVPYRS